MSWKIFHGKPKQPHNQIAKLPPPPSWRQFRGDRRGEEYQPRGEEIDLVNAALYLRRPLLITGSPGTGKTSLAYAVAKELQLGEVLRWNITTRSTLQEGLWDYDAIGRLQEAESSGKDNLEAIGKYIQLGPLGTALLPSDKPRVLLVDEIDKSDIDLPNDLLNVFEEGTFKIPELARIDRPEITVNTYDDRKEKIVNGRIPRDGEFPLVILTSNAEREFPPAFLRRCLRLHLQDPTEAELEQIVTAHLGAEILSQAKPIVAAFWRKVDTEKQALSTDQLLRAVYLLTREGTPDTESEAYNDLLEKLLHPLNES